MSEAAQQDPLTRYLLYKASVQSGDRRLAAECLEVLSTSGNSQDYLYACMVDARQSGYLECTLDCLQQLVAKYDYETPNPIHIPAVFRCAIRLLYRHISDGNDKDSQDKSVENLCAFYDEGRQAPWFLSPPMQRLTEDYSRQGHPARPR